MANLIKTQMELHKQLDKALKNFKKTPKARLTETYAQVKLELLEDLWNNFKQNHQILMITTEINIHESDYIKNEIYDLTEDIFTAAKCEMKEILKTFCSPNPTSDSNQTTLSQSKAPTAMTPELKLPHINIPVFTGKYSEWIPFHDLFVSLIHRNSALMDVQKLHYLKSSLSGEAATLLKHIPISEANYEDAWVILQKRYNNKRFIPLPGDICNDSADPLSLLDRDVTPPGGRLGDPPLRKPTVGSPNILWPGTPITQARSYRASIATTCPLSRHKQNSSAAADNQPTRTALPSSLLNRG
ncbi:uncharacterized protein LOC131843203 [Achroia grisella]|uniref:uncharacterized protein LOC131843203 n=1 Tax=Achroia grisella TaxID=688607 RepID=UPI0027D1F802|nr:uncharacterized protein LOC131843203 [Achroia grisella]